THSDDPNCANNCGTSGFILHRGETKTFTLTYSLTSTPPAGGATPLATGLNRPWAVATDGSRVYWSENDPGQAPIRSVPISGGSVAAIATGLAEPDAIAVDGTSVYWVERNGGDNGVLKKAPKGGGSSTLLVNGLHNAQNFLALDAASVYFGDGNPGGSGSI